MIVLTNLPLLCNYAVWDYDACALSNDFIGFLEIDVQDLSIGRVTPLKPLPEPQKQNTGSIEIVSFAQYDPTTPRGKVNVITWPTSFWRRAPALSVQIRAALKEVYTKLDADRNCILVLSTATGPCHTALNPTSARPNTSSTFGAPITRRVGSPPLNLPSARQSKAEFAKFSDNIVAFYSQEKPW